MFVIKFCPLCFPRPLYSPSTSKYFRSLWASLVSVLFSVGVFVCFIVLVVRYGMYMVRVRIYKLIKLWGLNNLAVKIIQYIVFPYGGVYLLVLSFAWILCSTLSSDWSDWTCGFGFEVPLCYSLIRKSLLILVAISCPRFCLVCDTCHVVLTVLCVTFVFHHCWKMWR